MKVSSKILLAMTAVSATTEAFAPSSTDTRSSSTTTITTRSVTTTQLHSSMFNSGTQTRTTNDYNYDTSLRQPGVAGTSSLARVGRAPTGGNTQTLERRPTQDYPTVDPNNTSQRRLKPIQIQGGSLKTWTFPSPRVESVQVFLKTEGRPLNANVEVWQGPGAYNNTKLSYSIIINEKGSWQNRPSVRSN